VLQFLGGGLLFGGAGGVGRRPGLRLLGGNDAQDDPYFERAERTSRLSLMATAAHVRDHIRTGRD
jgi:hypothetical protein